MSPSRGCGHDPVTDGVWQLVTRWMGLVRTALSNA
jgi:hypothetical protein